MNLENILNSRVNYMTQITSDPYQKGVVVATDEKGYIDSSGLEDKLVHAGYTKHARSQALKGVDSLNYLNMHMSRLQKRGVLQEQRDYFKSIGYNGNYPDNYRIAISGKNGVVAFTDGKILGVPTDLKRKARGIARQAGVPVEIAMEYVSFHENGHKAQPKYIFDNELAAEMDAEGRSYDFFSKKANQQKKFMGKLNYKRMAKFAMNRLNKYKKQVKQAKGDYKRAA